jgi:hypothetical protein
MLIADMDYAGVDWALNHVDMALDRATLSRSRPRVLRLIRSMIQVDGGGSRPSPTP